MIPLIFSVIGNYLQETKVIYTFALLFLQELIFEKGFPYSMSPVRKWLFARTVGN